MAQRLFWKSLKLLLLLLMVVALAALVREASGRAPTAITQPIAFNHFAHTKPAELECDVCHRYVKEQEYAGCPDREICVACHESPQTESAAEATLVEYLRSGKSIAWHRLYNIPDHLFFSHRRHVTVAKIDCSECHGPIGQSTVPPGAPLKIISMALCIGCHEKQGATVDCNGCHR